MPVSVAGGEQPPAVIAASPVAAESGPQPALIQQSGPSPALNSQVLPIAGDGAAMPVVGQAGELPPVEADGYVVSAELLPGLKTTPVLQGSVPAIQVEQPAPSDGRQPNRTSWTVQMALDALKGTHEQPTILGVQSSDARRQVPITLASGESLGTELSPAVAVPLASDLSTPQLMEFVGTRFETAQYAGLEYLEMAQRIMERVSAARSAGNGLYNAHLDLNPPNLGKMFVNISVRGDAVALQIAVAATVPREQLKDSLEALRQSLEDEGLYVVELQVHEVSGDEHGSNSQQQPDSERDDSEAQSGDQVVKTTPSLNPARKSTPALGFNS
jgi:flagellar hook-length control protein FliK